MIFLGAGAPRRSGQTLFSPRPFEYKVSGQMEATTCILAVAFTSFLRLAHFCAPCEHFIFSCALGRSAETLMPGLRPSCSAPA